MASYFEVEDIIDVWCGMYELGCRYGVELVCKKQPLLRGRGVSHCKNLLSPRFETAEGILFLLELEMWIIWVRENDFLF